MHDEPSRYPWLRLATSWVTIVTYVGGLTVAVRGLTRIDAIVTSWSDDWHALATTLLVAVAHLMAAALLIAAGFALVDFIRLAIDCESQLRDQVAAVKEIKHRSRRSAAPLPAPSSSSREILASLGVVPGMRAPAAVPDAGVRPPRTP